MATMQCKGCGRNVSAQLITCPDCGTAVGYSGGTPTSIKAEAMRLYNSQDYEGAVAAFTEAIGVDPNDVAAYRLRADAYRRLGREEEAEVDSRKIAELGQRQAASPRVVRQSARPASMRQQPVQQRPPRAVAQLAAVREIGDLPGGYWVALSAIVVAFVGLFLPGPLTSEQPA